MINCFYHIFDFLLKKIPQRAGICNVFEPARRRMVFSALTLPWLRPIALPVNREELRFLRCWLKTHAAASRTHQGTY